MAEIKRVLVAVDHSEPCLRAAELAANIARRCDAELMLLTVVRHLDAPDPGLARFVRDEHSPEPIALVIEEAARSELYQLSERLAKAAGQPASCEVAIGEPARTIVSFAAHHGIDMIALGHTGHGQLTRLVLGSVAKQVIDTATCSVLVVR